MKQTNNNGYVTSFDDEIDLKELFFVLLRGKKIIASLTGSLFIIGLIYSLFLDDIYESEALLAPVDESSSLMSGALSQYSGLANLAGINLSADDQASNSKKAIQMMDSLSFFENRIMPKIFLPDLMALKSWDRKDNAMIYDETIYNQNSNTWVREFSYPKKLVPSAQESYKAFKNHFNLFEDTNTGYIAVSVKHRSPFIAKQWTDLIVEEINSFYRQKDKEEAEAAIIYLNNQIARTSLSEIKQVTASVLQKEIQKLTLIEARSDYVFEYIYPPSVMEQKSEPSRSILVILYALAGFMLGILVVLMRHYFLRDSERSLESMRD